MNRLLLRVVCSLVVLIQFFYLPLFYWIFCTVAVLFVYCIASRNKRFNDLWLKVQHLWQDFGEYSEVYGRQSASVTNMTPPVYMQQATSYMTYPANVTAGQDLPAEAWYADKRDSQDVPTIRPGADGLRRPVLASYGKYRRADISMTPRPRRVQAPPLVTSTSTPTGPAIAQPRFTGMEFRKRSASGTVGDPNSPDLVPRRTSYAIPQFVYQANPSVLTKQQSLKSRLMSALGTQPLRTVPPGLINNGQNICFMNSVLQCLCHSPDLVEGLLQVCQTNPQVSPLVRSLTDILHGLDAKPGSYGEAYIDTTHFRHIASDIGSSMIAAPGSWQHQQDAGEFIMWLLQHAHSGLNHRNNLQPPTSHHSPIKTLKFIYGDLSEENIAELKTQCEQEIERGSMTDGISYAEPLQRLADLEWLSYKEKNNSIINDLFTGMRMEAQQCSRCHKISVFPQPFNILTVPLVKPNRDTGLAYLYQCFEKFGLVEELNGSEGLQCTCMSQTSLNAAPSPSSSPELSQDPLLLTVTPALNAKHKVFIREGVISPILGNGHVVNTTTHPSDNTLGVWTSTPIRAGSPSIDRATNNPPAASVSPSKRTCGKRRSLLRQLPQCLVVQLMRFSFKDGQLFKDQRPIQVELENLDLGHLVVDSVMQREDLSSLNDSHHYELYAMCAHLGGQTSSSGHYIAYARAMDGRWYKYDDELVSHVNISYELNTRTVRENAYLLFYRMKDDRLVKVFYKS